MKQELIYQVALTLIPQVGDVCAKELLDQLGSASALFKTKVSQLEKIPGIGEVRARAIHAFQDFGRAEAEIAFMQQHGIQAVFYTDTTYPLRLKNCYDAPVLLFQKGNASLHHARMVSIIGTRNNTTYGKEVCEAIVATLAPLQVMIVSGLAYGIDVIAHKAALKHQLPTIGVLAHGLDRVYPPAHQSIAKQMLENGALLTDFMSGTNPDKQNFPRRNRIVAGLCDAVIVVETGLKGGSLITAEIANSYHRDVLAVPGRISDAHSAGCNLLIRQNKAALVSTPDDVIGLLGWDTPSPLPKIIQKELFLSLNEEEKMIVELLKQKNSAHIDEICLQSRLSSSRLAATMLNLELQGLLRALPGKMYQLT